MSQDVYFKLKGKASNQNINFRYEDSRIKENESIPTSKITIIGGVGSLEIKVDVGRNGDKYVATWYKDFVGNDPLHMIHSKSGANKPEKLNLALKGWLSIGEEECHVCFGQGHYTGVNNWHLCSLDILARDNNKSGYLDNTYYVSTKDSENFEIEYAEEISEGKGVSLWAFTNSNTATPRFDMEGDTLHPFPFQASNLSGVGSMQRGKAYDTTGVFPAHRDFHLQVISGTNHSQLIEVLYKIDRVTGAISGPPVLEQTVKTFNNASGVPYLMNYGMSHAAQPLTNQSYVYTAPTNPNWLEKLMANCPEIQMNQLVLPGSHDAGMYQMNGANLDLPWWSGFALAGLTLLFPVCGAYLSTMVAAYGTKTAISNLSITQKDTAYDQMLIGTRYFDFRPAYPKGAGVSETYHIHNFVPGVLFKEFLSGIDKYLSEHTKEVAIIRIADSGIDKEKFDPLTKDEVDGFLVDTISESVGYNLSTSFGSYKTEKLSEVVDSGKRLIVIYGGLNDNNSYNEEAYSKSLNNPEYVIGALNKTVEKRGNFDLTILQLQNTGSGALPKYTGAIAANCTAWANDLLASESGNLLQATKPIFDHSTYTWLTQDNTIEGIVAQGCPVVIQNDFVDVGLTERATALSTKVYNNSKEETAALSERLS